MFILSCLKRLGANLKLSNRTIQFTPVKYLVPIAEKYLELKEQFELARTDSEQMKKGLKEGLISQCARTSLVIQNKTLKFAE